MGKAGELWHVVLISFYAVTPEEIRNRICLKLASLGEECGGPAEGILYWHVGWNQDMRKNFHLVEIARFTNGDALQKFRSHARHQEVVALMRDAADWVVGDLPCI